MIAINVQAIIIIALLAFIVGIFAGALLTKPHYPRMRGGYRRYDD
jgi:hypothetical protein